MQKTHSVLIIGGSGGIGQSLAAEANLRGAHVAIISRKKAPKTIDTRWCWYQDTIENEEHSIANVNKAIEHQPDTIFICNGVLHDASGMPEKAIHQLDSQTLTLRLQSNVIVPAHYLRLLFAYISKQPEVKILVLSAKIGSISDNGLGGWYSYRMSKAALNMLVKTLSIELARENKTATIVAVHPGTTDTELSKPFQKNLPPGQLQTGRQTAKRLFKVRDKVDTEHSGELLNWDGEIIQP